MKLSKSKKPKKKLILKKKIKLVPQIEVKSKIVKKKIKKDLLAKFDISKFVDLK